jgi:hypothetical protein
MRSIEIFEEQFGHLFYNHSVKFGDIDNDLSTDYIKRLIREDHISNASVVVVLVGPKTFCRKHIDWEISAALTKTIGNCGYAGLFGLCLPHHPNFGQSTYTRNLVPARLVDNLLTGYAELYDWTTTDETILKFVNAAFQRRNSPALSRDNRRLQMMKNICG